MKWFNYIRPRNWSIVKVYRDFENFGDWRRVVKKEQANPKSNFNKWKLDRTKLFDVYLTLSLNEEDAILPDTAKRIKLMEMLNPLHRYFDDTLGFSECLNIEFNQYEDDEKNPTLSYLIVYRFNFNKFSIKWLFKFLIYLTIIILGSIYYIIPWLSSLI